MRHLVFDELKSATTGGYSRTPPYEVPAAPHGAGAVSHDPAALTHSHSEKWYVGLLRLLAIERSEGGHPRSCRLAGEACRSTC